MSKFRDMIKKKRLEAFDLVLNSYDEFGAYNGFDLPDASDLPALLELLEPHERQAVYNNSQYKASNGKRTIKGLIDDHYYIPDDQKYIPDYHDNVRKVIWYEVFKRLSSERQVLILEKHEELYDKMFRKQAEGKYDWSEFRCALEEKGETSKLQQIKTAWSDLGMQVYGCHANPMYDRNRCPCLREAVNSSAFKCFRDYLQSNDKHPNGEVPYHKRQY